MFCKQLFFKGLLAWQENIDIQPVINQYKAATYMCAYFSKSEDETSETMKLSKLQNLMFITPSRGGLRLGAESQMAQGQFA